MLWAPCIYAVHLWSTQHSFAARRAAAKTDAEASSGIATSKHNDRLPTRATDLSEDQTRVLHQLYYNRLKLLPLKVLFGQACRDPTKGESPPRPPFPAPYPLLLFAGHIATLLTALQCNRTHNPAIKCISNRPLKKQSIAASVEIVRGLSL